MKYKKRKWWIALFLSCLAGTITGALFNEYFTLPWLFGAVILSPLSLMIRIVGSFGSLFPNIGISVWTTHFWNSVDIVCAIISVIFSLLFFKTEKYSWLITFGISFAILNAGNMNQFVAMMSI